MDPALKVYRDARRSVAPDAGFEDMSTYLSQNIAELGEVPSSLKSSVPAAAASSPANSDQYGATKKAMAETKKRAPCPWR